MRVVCLIRRSLRVHIILERGETPILLSNRVYERLVAENKVTEFVRGKKKETQRSLTTPKHICRHL